MRHALLAAGGLAAALWIGADAVAPPAHAVVGAPATPVSYAGVARRTSVRVATPGLGAPGVGVGGVGNRPGDRGGPVNRVGRR